MRRAELLAALERQGAHAHADAPHHSLRGGVHRL
jgi:hypothetical protein